MEKKWRQAKETEITAILPQGEHRPGQRLRLDLGSSSMEELILQLECPADAGAESGECRIVEGAGSVGFIPVIPGSYPLFLTGVKGGGGSYALRIGGKLHVWDGRKVPLGELVVKW